ncbi:helix-turn-helix transcriptional regulator [Inquilinus sp. CAU 1745]|uniref:helix-turn-helix domain-containing protein n=1 Tax=Inquilinus sp. CAU 1745 TaxID=3140369 RepID=UPI00325BC70B
MQDTFPANLAFACSLFPSIADVCRRVGINRQQFNKYLSGQVRPSRHNMRRICDFFGVTESELLLEEGRFADLLSLRRDRRGEIAAPPYVRQIEKLVRLSARLDRYVGCYYRYFYAFSYPGRIIRSFAMLWERDGRYYWKNIERHAHQVGQPAEVSKYDGMAFFLGERIMVVEYERLLATSITEMMLYPSYRSSVDYLLGLQTGGPLKRGRMPSASTVMLEYLGPQVDFRRALSRCGTFAPDELDPRIAKLIENRILPDSWVFEIEQL